MELPGSEENTSGARNQQHGGKKAQEHDLEARESLTPQHTVGPSSNEK